MIDFENQPFKFGEEIEVSDDCDFIDLSIRVGKFICYDPDRIYKYSVQQTDSCIRSYKYARPIKKRKEVFEWLRVHISSGSVTLCDRFAETEQDLIKIYDQGSTGSFRFIKTGRSFWVDA